MDEKSGRGIPQSDDPFIRLAVKLHDIGLSLEEREEVDGNLERVIPQYMQAVIDWKKSQGKPVYPDANSTLRVTYGTVAPYSPRDGISKGPFTTVEGIVEKHTGKAPFNAPEALLPVKKNVTVSSKIRCWAPCRSISYPVQIPPVVIPVRLS
jgi:hypothetical protein